MRFLRTRPAPNGPDSKLSRHFAIVIFGLWVTLGTFAPAVAQSDADFEPTWHMVVDWANLLDEGQEISAIDDTWRLNLLDIPAQVVTELVESTPALAQQRAEALRIEHGIESAPGAGDGILVYAAVNPANRSLIMMAIAVGPNALPSGGLTQSDIAEIESIIVVPQLTAGHPARAIVYAMREMIYQQVFTPPLSSSPSGAQASLNSIMPWLAPLFAIPVAVVALHNTRVIRTPPSAWKQAVPPLLSGLVLAVVAIDVRSAAGGFWAIGLVLLSVAVLIRVDQQPQLDDRRARSTTPPVPVRFSSHSEVGS